MITATRIFQGIIWLMATLTAFIAVLPFLVIGGIWKVFKSIINS
jgi:hypothetical protein